MNRSKAVLIGSLLVTILAMTPLTVLGYNGIKSRGRESRAITERRNPPKEMRRDRFPATIFYGRPYRYRPHYFYYPYRPYTYRYYYYPYQPYHGR